MLKLLTIVFLLLFKDKNFVDYFDLLFLAETLRDYFKIQLFSQKIARNKLLWSNLIKFAWITHPKTTNTIFENSMGASHN